MARRRVVATKCLRHLCQRVRRFAIDLAAAAALAAVYDARATKLWAAVTTAPKAPPRTSIPARLPERHSWRTPGAFACTMVRIPDPSSAVDWFMGVLDGSASTR